MIIKIYDHEYEEYSLVEIDSNENDLKEKVEFFFCEDNFYDDNFKKLSLKKITEIFNGKFKEWNKHFSLNRVKEALEITQYAECGETIERCIDVLNALGYKTHEIESEDTWNLY